MMLRLGPLRLHWSLLLGAALFCTLQPRPLLLLGYAAVLLIHLTGHAMAAPGVRGVPIHGLGAEIDCEQSPLRRSIRAWPGPLAEPAALLAASLLHLPAALPDAL